MSISNRLTPIEKFVENGGGVIVTGRSGLHRPSFPLMSKDAAPDATIETLDNFALSKLVGLDFAGGETAAGSTVRAGKYLNDDVYLELEQGAASGTGRARVEVEIMPNVSVQADTGADAQSGVGVQWRYDF